MVDSTLREKIDSFVPANFMLNLEIDVIDTTKKNDIIKYYKTF